MGQLVKAQQEARDKAHSASNGTGKGDAAWRGYINVQLDSSQKAQFDDWMKTDEPWDMLAAVVSSGCQVSVKLNPGSGGFLASITQRNAASVNNGLCITARAGEAGKAIFRALFLVNVLGVEADWGAAQAPADPDRW